MAQRPERLRIIHELGKYQSLPSGTHCFTAIGQGRDILFAGLGPDIGDAVEIARQHLQQVQQEGCGPEPVIRYIECPEFAEQMPAHWRSTIPADWHPVTSEELIPILRQSTSYLYQRGARLFPTFWGPVFATIRMTHMRPQLTAPLEQSVILPGSENTLLIRELHAAFSEAGYRVYLLCPESIQRTLPELLRHVTPALFFSVNFLGLDAFGEHAHILQAIGCPVAAWCVDTPWHILSGCKAPYWQSLHLFVTDESFIPSLNAHGAQRVYHLPLAAAQEMVRQPTATNVPCKEQNNHYSELAERIVFVGNSAFPAQEKFFSGLTPDSSLLQKAQGMLQSGLRPDYHWWTKELGHPSLWPLADFRAVGCGTDTTARIWRTLCLLEAAKDNTLTVFGDNGWNTLIPSVTDKRPPVDYYRDLPSIYRQSGISVNITSLLLPAGLTQRHFDVWAAGGTLLTDATAGLHIFPAELTQPCTYHSANEISELCRLHIQKNTETIALQKAWREHILAEHQYKHRIKYVLDVCKTPQSTCTS